jgi:hypothetical protein
MSSPDYMTQMLEADCNPEEPISIWEVAFECDVSPEGDLMEDSLDVSAGNDGTAAISKVRKYVLSSRYLQQDAGHVPVKFLLKGLRLLATEYAT